MHIIQQIKKGNTSILGLKVESRCNKITISSYLELFFLRAFELDGTSKLGLAGNAVVVKGGCNAPSPAMAIASLLQFIHQVRR